MKEFFKIFWESVSIFAYLVIGSNVSNIRENKVEDDCKIEDKTEYYCNRIAAQQERIFNLVGELYKQQTENLKLKWLAGFLVSIIFVQLYFLVWC